MHQLRNALILAFVVFALPLFGQKISSNIEVLVDLSSHRAYVPYGTVLPPGLQLRVAKKVGRQPWKLLNERLPDGSFSAITDPQSFLGGQSPLVFEYAPETRFEESRKLAHKRKAASEWRVPSKIGVLSRNCGTIQVSAASEGQYGTEYQLFDSTFCYTAGVAFDQSDLREFTAYTYPQDETWAHVQDNLDNYHCFDQHYGYSAAGCTASQTTSAMATCDHAVYVEGYARHYEWGDNYVFSPVDFFFSVSYCYPITE